MVSAALTAIGLTAGLSVAAPQPAQAVTLNGLCDWNQGYNDCVRQNAGGFYDWARDISGDTNQQMGRSYQGQVSSSGCWPFTCGGGNNGNFDGAAVYKIFNIHSGLCMAASNLSTVAVYAQSCSSNGTNWVWDGTVNVSHLINVYQTNGHSNVVYKLNPFGGRYRQLVTNQDNESWGMVPVIG